ncbi:MAG: hypothetical protein ACRYF2_10325, partial [Janthinobacterium lividum]
MICSSENRFCFIRPPRHRPDSSSKERKRRGSRQPAEFTTITSSGDFASLFSSMQTNKVALSYAITNNGADNWAGIAAHSV